MNLIISLKDLLSMFIDDTWYASSRSINMREYMFPFVSKWLSSISNDQLWLKGGGREAREAVDASNVMCQEGNDDEDGENFLPQVKRT